MKRGQDGPKLAAQAIALDGIANTLADNNPISIM